MAHEVVIVGGGIGGLTAGALLAARGVDVCLIEKESRVGGCVTSFEKFNYTFEPGMGLYSSWQAGEIHQRVFAELPVAAPEVRKLSPAYVVRLPDQSDIAVVEDTEELADTVRARFPECADEAIGFYRGIERLSKAHCGSQRPPLSTTASKLGNTSPRFRRFIDAQLQIFAQGDSESCAYSDAIFPLTAPLRGLYAISGGASALADELATSIKKSGGMVRTDTTVLRLAYDASGRATGVDLMTGETVGATRAIISNLTVWDTYGKLVGLSKTPNDIRSRLKQHSGWGAYLLFVGMDDEASVRLLADRILGVTDWQEGQAYDPEQVQFTLAAAPEWDRRAPEGKRAVTISTVTEASQWFAFHEDESDLEAQDQAALESWWMKLHSLLPELGSGVEVINTMTPRDYYQHTRRKLGMVNGINRDGSTLTADPFMHRTRLPNLFMVGDTVFPGHGVASVTQSGLIVANEIAPSLKG
ncbi:MAG: hypothetical protein QOJ64_1746 [Acidobacteriota bacterium]|jgi:phytoene dehydrogenase-like protein|nr:hypothetical protein [Acidobacteriota bacterium]